MNKKGFTLIELLAVIAVIAVMLLIAVPSITNILDEAKKSSLQATTKSIISSAEERYYENKLLHIKGKIRCEDLIDLKEEEYGLCKITFDEEGNATVILNGKEDGKYDNLACQGTKEGITCQEGEIKPGLNCTFDGELVQGAEYINGQYEYFYDINRSGGWRVKLTDNESTEPVTTKVCSYINGNPIVSTADMFFNSKATSIDLSGFDTGNVTNMSGMFRSLQTEELDLSGFDTSNVTNMDSMFIGVQIEELDLSSFDTSNVTNMSGMFADSSVTSIDLCSFDTSNVTDMSAMFIRSAATKGYARTQADADKFNASSGKPEWLVFEVKSNNN